MTAATPQCMYVALDEGARLPSSGGRPSSTTPPGGAAVAEKEQRGKVDLARQQREIDRIRAEKSALTREDRRVTTRATIRVVTDTRLEGRLGRFRVSSDEPADRGGDGTAPSPLQFLMAAVGF